MTVYEHDPENTCIDSIGDDTWRAPAAQVFKGEIIVAKDLMVI